MGTRDARRSRCAIVVRPWRGCGRLPVSRRVLVLVLACPAALVPGCYVDYVAGERVDTQATGTTATGTTASGSGTTASLDADTTAVTTTVASGTDAEDPDGTTASPITCDAPAGHTVCDDGPDPFQAIGLGCPGTPFDSTPLLASGLDSPDETAWRLTRELGNAFWTPREGSQLLVLSTGTLPLPDASGRIELPLGHTDAVDGNNGNPDGAGLPEPIATTPGSSDGAGGMPFVDCDGIGDCSDTVPVHLAAGGPPNDLLSLSFDVAVPEQTHGWRVDLVWLSAEFPVRVDAPANDAFVWWVSSEAYVGNIATDGGAPMSATGLRPRLSQAGLVGDSPALLDTGFQGTAAQPCEYPWAAYPACPRGAATGWLTLDGPAHPGEILTLTAALFDQGDTELDTMVVLDDWRWHCPGCTPGQDCGLSTAAR